MSRLARTIAKGATLTTVILATSLATGVVRAHEEPMHGVGTMLAYRYLLDLDSGRHEESTHGDVRERVKRALPTLQQTAQKATAPHTDQVQDRTRRFLLGIEDVDSQGSTVPMDFNKAPVREHPGLSGHGAGVRELPRRDAALLGYLVANVDTHHDTWANAKSPYQYVEELIEDGLRPNVVTSAIDAAVDASSWCTGDWYQAMACLHACATLGLYCQYAVPLLGAAVGAAGAVISNVISLTDVPEGVAEDFVSGCDSNWGGGKVAARIEKEEAEAATYTLGYGGLTPGEAAYLRDDHGFFRRYGVSFEQCDATEEYLGSIRRLVSPGRPRNQQGLIFTVRARMLDYMKLDPSVRGTNERASISSHFEALEPWFASAEATKRAIFTNAANPVKLEGCDPELSTGAKAGDAEECLYDLPGGMGVLPPPSFPDYTRWRTESLTMVNHFLNVAGSTGYAPISPANEGGIEQMLAGRPGSVHPFGGYSLRRRFSPANTLNGSARLFLDFGLDAGYRDREVVQAKGRELDVKAHPASHYVTWRRRVCDGNVGPSLETSDGLGWSDCAKATPNPRVGNSPFLLDRDVNAPADLGALDGFHQWMHGGLYDALQDHSGGSHTQFATYHPFIRQMAPTGRAPDMSQPFCTTPGCRDDATTGTYEYDYRKITREANIQHADTMRLRGLALALHMIQDMTVPQHLVSTTAYGHQGYEQFFQNYVYPFHAGGKTRDYWNQRISLIDHQGTLGHSFASGSHFASLPATIRPKDSAETLGADAEGHFDTLVAHLNWNAVKTEYDNLSTHMATLANKAGGCEAERFSTRRLVWATAYRTLEILEEAHADAFSQGFDASGLTDPRREQVRQIAFWFASSVPEDPKWGKDLKASLEERFPGKLFDSPTSHMTVAMPGWKAMADKSLPVMIAASVHMLLGAGEALADPSTTCDAGGTTTLPPQQATVAPPPSPDGTCEALAKITARDCMEAGRTNCPPFDSASSFSGCLAATTSAQRTERQCDDVIDAVAECSCMGDDDGDLSGYTTCVRQLLRVGATRQLLAQGKIDEATSSHQLGITAPDSDRDGIPNAVDACPNQELPGEGKLRYTSISQYVCLMGVPGCAYGCLPN